MIKIEVGKCYLSRDGRKCFVFNKPECLVDTYEFARVEYDADEMWENKLDRNRYVCNSNGIVYSNDVNPNDEKTLTILSWFDLVEEI